MSVVSRRNAVVIGSLLLLCSLGFGGWTTLVTGTPAALNAICFPTGTQVGYTVGADPAGGGTIMKTTDGGDTWVTQNSGVLNGLNSVYFTTDNNGYAVGSQGTALRTTDGGTTWAKMTGVTGSDQLNYVQFPGNGLVGYIGLRPQLGGAKVLKTTDGGTTWSPHTAGQALNTSISCGMANVDTGAVVGVNGLISCTTNGWSAWDTSFGGSQTHADLIAVAFSSASPNKGYLIGNDTSGGTQIGIIRHTAAGAKVVWDSCRCWDVTAFYGVCMADSVLAYVCGSGGNILVSAGPTDFWRTTTGVTTVISGLSFPVGADTGYACGGNGTILKTTDKGIPWLPGVAEAKTPTVVRTGIRVVSNPARNGITLRSDADVRVSVFDAAGRVVKTQAATKGLNFLPVPTGAYFVRAGAQTARAVVTN